jgi:hypothetical protein
MDVLFILSMIPEGNIIQNDLIYSSIKTPRLSIKDYGYRLYKYILHDMDLMKFAYYYIVMYSTYKKIIVTQQNIHLLLLASVVATHKFWDDNTLDISIISEICGVEKKEFVLLERDFLNGINWQLYAISSSITIDEFKYISECLTGLSYDQLTEEYNKYLLLNIGTSVIIEKKRVRHAIKKRAIKKNANKRNSIRKNVIKEDSVS